MKAYGYYFREFMEHTTALGSIFLHGILIAVAFALKDPLFLPLVKGLLLLFLITIPIKFLFFKTRPKKMVYKNFWQKFEASSFPSVHTARALFLALTLCAYFKNTLLSVFLFLLATLVAYSRIYLKKHYWTDVGAGIIIGIAVYTATVV